MSGVYIKGIEMPTDHPLWIVVHSDGTVEANEVSASRPVGWQTLRNAAIPVPPHGRLIDADALMKGEGRYIISFGKEGIDVAEINRAPTIIPASEKVYDKYTDTAGNLHWIGTHSGKHTIREEGGE